MTAAMPGYGAELPDNLLLGHIAWYTITKPKVTQPEMADLVATLGLSPSITPKEPRLGDAFKRACRYSERSGLSIPMSLDKANFLIRTVSQGTVDVERHLVLERVDAQGKHLEYTTAARLTFDRKEGKLRVSKLNMPDNLDGLVIETLNMFHTNFDEATVYIDAQVIRRMVREQMTISGGIAIRRKGSVYFMPIKARKETEALEQFCTHMGDGSVFNSVPLPDTTKQRDMVKLAFEDEVHEEATTLMTKLRKVQVEETQITSAAWADYSKKIRDLQNNYGDYNKMVEGEMSKAQTELEALSKQLKGLVMNGLVKS